MTVLLLILGLLLLLAGNYFLVESAVAILQRGRVARYVTGITAVGIGMALPQMVVAVLAAAQGLGDIAMGTAVGANAFGLLAVLGVMAIISPFAVTRHNTVRDITFGIFMSILLMLLCADSLLPHITQNEVGRMDAVFLLLIYAVYLFMSVMHSRREENSRRENEELVSSRLTGRPAWLLWGIAVLSLAAMLAGGKMVVDGTVALAQLLGASHKVLSLTAIGIGTSLPLLAIAISAARRKQPLAAVGAVINRSVTNVVLTLGIAALVGPIVLDQVNLIDIGVMTLAAVLVFFFAFMFRRHALHRHEGIILIAIYLGYIIYMLI